MKRKAKVEKATDPVQLPKEKTFNEIVQENLEQSKKMLAVAREQSAFVQAYCKRVKEELENLKAGSKVSFRVTSRIQGSVVSIEVFNELHDFKNRHLN